MTAQGWDQATYRCGRCSDGFTATTEAEYVLKYRSHQLVHDLLDASTPELRARILEHALAAVALEGGEAGQE